MAAPQTTITGCAMAVFTVPLAVARLDAFGGFITDGFSEFAGNALLGADGDNIAALFYIVVRKVDIFRADIFFARSE